MSPTILDMEQVFGLRPSGRIVDVTHDLALPSRPIAESSFGHLGLLSSVRIITLLLSRVMGHLLRVLSLL